MELRSVPWRVWLSAVTGVVLLVVAVASLKWYLWDVVVAGAGEADRSMLFWGLPIAFIGIFALGGVAAMYKVVRSHLVTIRAGADQGE